MDSVMVTGRMPENKKNQAMRVLKRSGMNASQAINRMFDLLIERGSADFLEDEDDSTLEFAQAASFVDGLSRKKSSRFDDMSKREIKADRLASRGLM